MLPLRDGVFDIVVSEERIARVEPSGGAAEWVGLPPLADLHLHACRAFTLGAAVPRDFNHAIALVIAQAAELSSADYERQALRTFSHVMAKGTALVRTHADVGGPFGTKALEGTLAARAVFQNRLDIEVVALLGPTHDAGTPEGAGWLREARGSGADLLGAVPCHYPEPGATIDAVLDLAIELDCAVDLHLDEHLDASRSWSGHLARSVLQRGLNGRVTLSHGCAVTMHDRGERQRLAAALAEAGVAVIALPATNLYLQDRGDGTPRQRGLTAVKELLAAGAAVRFASDNIRDVFNPYGSGDLLDIAALAALTAQIDSPGHLVAAICAGRSDLKVGEAADFLLVRGETFVEILAERPAERRRIKAGRELPRTSWPAEPLQ